jgi:hypothetical protein
MSERKVGAPADRENIRTKVLESPVSSADKI